MNSQETGIIKNTIEKYQQCKTYQDFAKHMVTYHAMNTSVYSEVNLHYIRGEQFRYVAKENGSSYADVLQGKENEIYSSVMKKFGKKQALTNETVAYSTRIISKIPSFLFFDDKSAINPFFKQNLKIKRIEDAYIENNLCYVLEQEEYNIITKEFAQEAKDILRDTLEELGFPEAKKDKPFGMSLLSGKNERKVWYWIRQSDYAILQIKTVHLTKELGDREDVITFFPTFDEPIQSTVFDEEK